MLNISDLHIINQIRKELKPLMLERIEFLLNKKEINTLMLNLIKKHINFINNIIKNPVEKEYPTRVWRIVKLPRKQSNTTRLINELLSFFPS